MWNVSRRNESMNLLKGLCLVVFVVTISSVLI